MVSLLIIVYSLILMVRLSRCSPLNRSVAHSWKFTVTRTSLISYPQPVLLLPALAPPNGQPAVAQPASGSRRSPEIIVFIISPQGWGSRFVGPRLPRSGENYPLDDG
jgi:hypothetical protein